MAKQDQGYRRATGSSYSGGGGRGRTLSTYLAQTRKNEVADLYIRTQTSGILDVLGLEDDTDLAAVALVDGARGVEHGDAVL